MHIKRYIHLCSDDTAMLTPEEVFDGWHFCGEFDGLLVGPDMEEMQYCTCYKDVSAHDKLKMYQDYVDKYTSHSGSTPQG